MKKLLLLATTCLFAVPAFAQEGDIVVTARKFEELNKKSPVSIVHITGEQLERGGAERVSDITGIGAKSIVMSGDALLLSARGQVQNDISITTDASVATYVDGIYVARGYGLNTTLLDIKNVQVLYGPQGTLFGRNSTGGAILFTTNSPVPNKYEASVEGSYGNHDHKNSKGVVNIPVNNDITIRAAGLYEETDGFTTDRITHKHYGAKTTEQERVKVSYVPDNKTIQVEVTGEHYLSKGDTEARFMDYGFGTNAVLATPNPGDTVAINSGSFNRTEITGVYGNGNYANLKLTGGYRQVRSNHVGDWDGSTQNLFNQTINTSVKQYTGEVQYDGKLINTSYTLGGFYFQETGNEYSHTQLYGGYRTTQFDATINNKSYGTYLSTYTDLSDKLTLNASIRYTHDIKNVLTQNKALAPIVSCISTVQTASCSLNQHAGFNKVTWSTGLDYHFNDSTLVYAKVGTGYKSGGNQNRALSSERVEFQPENILEGEIGVKGETPLVTYSAAAFLNETKNYQILTVIPTPIVHTMVVNAAKTRNYGGEINLGIRVTSDFTLSGTAAFVEPKFIGYTARFNNVPKQQFTVAGTYKIDRYQFNANYNWVSSSNKNGLTETYLVNRYGTAEASKILDVTTIKAHGLLNVRASAEFGQAELSIWGKNVFNTRYKKDGTLTEGLFNTSTWNDPVAYGVTLGMKY